MTLVMLIQLEKVTTNHGVGVQLLWTKSRTRVKKFLYNKADYENIRTSLVALDWDHILSGTSVNDQSIIFSDI